MSFDHDQQRRAKIANELDRRDFWKDNFLIARQQGDTTVKACARADEALQMYEEKFGGVVK